MLVAGALGVAAIALWRARAPSQSSSAAAPSPAAAADAGPRAAADVAPVVAPIERSEVSGAVAVEPVAVAEHEPRLELAALRFVRAEDGAPLAGAEIRAVESDGRVTRAGAYVTQLRSDGSFEPAAGTESGWSGPFWLSAPGRSPLVFQREPTPLHAPATIVRVEAACALRVRVDDRRAALGVGLELVAQIEANELVAPEQRAQVALGGNASWSREARAGEACELTALPAYAPLSLRVVEGGRDVHVHGEVLVLAPGETREVAIELLGPGPALIVRALDERGVPHVGRTVGVLNRRVDAALGDTRALLLSNGTPAFHATATTDAHGIARFEQVPPGRWWIGLAPVRAPWDPPDPQAAAPLAELVELGAADASREHELVAPRGAYIRGRVVSEDFAGSDGGTRSGVNRVVLAAQGIGIGGGVTGDPEADGEFWLGPVTHDAYRLETFAAGWAPIEPLTVRAGDPPVVLRLRRGAQISGRIVDRVTRAGVSADVLLTRLGAPDGEHLGSSDGSGKYGFGGVSDGDCVVAALAPDGRSGTSRVVRVHNGVVVDKLAVELDPPGQATALRVTLEGAIDPGRVVVAAGGVCRAYQFVDGPESRVFACPRGEVDVRLYAGSRCVERRSVTLDAAPLEVRFRR